MYETYICIFKDNSKKKVLIYFNYLLFLLELIILKSRHKS